VIAIDQIYNDMQRFGVLGPEKPAQIGDKGGADPSDPMTLMSLPSSFLRPMVLAGRSLLDGFLMVLRFCVPFAFFLSAIFFVYPSAWHALPYYFTLTLVLSPKRLSLPTNLQFPLPLQRLTGGGFF
jgi:hypothetical protein